MHFTEILLIVSFVVILLLITLEVIDRSLGGVLGIIIVFLLFLLTGGIGLTDLIADIDFAIIFTILGIFISVEAVRKSGFFQWLGIKGIKATKGRPYPLFMLLCIASSLMTGILTSIAVVVIIGSLTIDTAKVLDINPLPYLAAEAITVNVGATITLIGSIPNIIIAKELDLSFAFFLINLAPFSLLLISITVFLLFKSLGLLESPSKVRRNFLMEFDEWTVVTDKRLFKEVAIIFFAMIGSFIVLPQYFHQIKLWFLALFFMSLFLLLPGMEAAEMLKGIDWETIFFLIGLYVLVGGLKPILDRAASGIQSVLGGNLLLTILVILWIVCLTSGVVDNIAVTVALIPVLRPLIASSSREISFILLIAFIIGVNIGGNLTPMASPTTVLAMSLSKKTEEELTPKKFFKIGFSVALIQNSIATAYLVFSFYLLQFGVGWGTILLLTLLGAILGFLALLLRKEATRRKLLGRFLPSKTP